MLIGILKVLSSTAEEQLRYLVSIGDASVDELALELEELMLMAPSMLEAGGITRQQFDLVGLLNKKLDDISGDDNADYWTESALAESADWAEVRKLASDCLVIFD